jgi:hypothetical protein
MIAPSFVRPSGIADRPIRVMSRFGPARSLTAIDERDLA